MAISLTSEAAEHVGRQLQSRGKGEGSALALKPLVAPVSPMFWNLLISPNPRTRFSNPTG